MVLQYMLSWKLLCTAPPRSTVALSRFPERRMRTSCFICVRVWKASNCAGRRKIGFKKNYSNQRAPKYSFWTDPLLAGRCVRTMTRDRLFKRAKCPTTSRLSDCFSTSDSNMSAALADMLPHGSGTSQGEEHGVLADRGPLRRGDTQSPQATHRDCMHCSSSVAASLNTNAMRTDTHNKNFVSSDREHAGKIQPSSGLPSFQLRWSQRPNLSRNPADMKRQQCVPNKQRNSSEWNVVTDKNKRQPFTVQRRTARKRLMCVLL